MTSKEIDKILKSPITQSAKGRFISIEKEKNLELAKQLGIDLTSLTPQPSKLEQCIKEWESRGYKVKENTEFHILFRHNINDDVVEIFKENLSYMYYPYFDDGTILSIPYDLHDLIHKTLKALEKIKNGN